MDTTGLLVAVHVTPANVQDRAAFPAPLAKTIRACSTIRNVWPDQGYTGPTVAAAAQKARVEVETSPAPNPPTGSSHSPRRWAVERTNGRINHHRRLVRHDENTTAAHEGFLLLSQIGLPLRRLDRGQLFDTSRDTSPAKCVG